MTMTRQVRRSICLLILSALVVSPIALTISAEPGPSSSTEPHVTLSALDILGQLWSSGWNWIEARLVPASSSPDAEPESTPAPPTPPPEEPSAPSGGDEELGGTFEPGG